MSRQPSLYLTVSSDGRLHSTSSLVFSTQDKSPHGTPAELDLQVKGLRPSEAEHLAQLLWKTCSDFASGYFGVPLVLVSGDRALAREVRSIDPAIRTIVVKEGVSRFSAVCDHPEVAREKIRAGVQQALSASRRPKPLRLRSPYRFEDSFRCSLYSSLP